MPYKKLLLTKKCKFKKMQNNIKDIVKNEIKHLGMNQFQP